MRPGYYIDGCVPDQILFFVDSSGRFTVIVGSKFSGALSYTAGYRSCCTTTSDRVTKATYITSLDASFTCTTIEEVQQQYPEFFI